MKTEFELQIQQIKEHAKSMQYHFDQMVYLSYKTKSGRLDDVLDIIDNNFKNIELDIKAVIKKLDNYGI